MPRITYKTVWNNFRSNGIKSIVISLITWMLVGVAIWFLLPSLFQKEMLEDVNASLSSQVKSVDLEWRLIRTIVLLVVQLGLMVWPMIEYLFVFHHQKNIHDKYKWYVPFILMICVCIPIILIADAVILAVGWITLIQILGILIVICIPRFLFPPR